MLPEHEAATFRGTGNREIEDVKNTLGRSQGRMKHVLGKSWYCTL